MATQMKPAADDDEAFAEFLEAAIRADDKVADRHFAAGQPVYFVEPETPADCVIKAFPDGRRELVTLDADGNEQPLTPVA